MIEQTHENNVLDEIVITKFEIIPKLLETIKQNPRISQNKLRIRSGYSGGKMYPSIKALKLMKLISNGDGLSITEFGDEFLNKYLETKQIPKDEIKQACLRIQLFNKIYSSNPNLIDPKKLFELFAKELKGKYPNINERLIGSAVRRYIEGLHNIKLRAGARTGSKLSMQEKKYKKKRIETINLNNNQEIINSLISIKQTLNLSNKELSEWINSLPIEKREIVISQIYSKAFE